ncbi:unnamed protein product [Phyllotreta striolata]|uniref:Uncharacterized protein n=1 Tax=Phyllotreta striolata TaxID=444603 RepID=A0A9N9TRR0_PHYSR|nr:unnamed protein product [Phyllotreta striolata]
MGNRATRSLESFIDFQNIMPKHYTSVADFKFHDPLYEEEEFNGLVFNSIFIPEEVLTQILSFIPPKELLPLTLVCKKWCNIIKSECIWMEIYNKGHTHRAKLLPWYVYYLYFTTDSFTNLLKNGNGKDGFKNWVILKNLGDQFKIEDPPKGSDPLPEGVPDFNGHTSCFVTSYYECNKIQEIQLENKRLLRYVMNKYRPQIAASEWVAARFDCGCEYKLTFRGFGPNYLPKEPNEYVDEEEIEDALFEKHKSVRFEQWAGKSWEKVELLVEDYPKNVKTLVFEHEGNDTQFWKGHYGSKMAGGVVKFLFESIESERD